MSSVFVNVMGSDHLELIWDVTFVPIEGDAKLLAPIDYLSTSDLGLVVV